MKDENLITVEDLGSIFAEQNKPILDFMKELRNGSIKVSLAEPAPAAKLDNTPVALAEAGMLDKAMKFEVWGIPVAQAAIGGAVAIFATELIDGFLAKQSDQTRGIIKLAAAGASAKWGKKIFGDTGSKAVALLLAFDGIRNLIPMDQAIKGWATKISGTLTNKGLAQDKDFKYQRIVPGTKPMTSSQMMAGR